MLGGGGGREQGSGVHIVCVGVGVGGGGRGAADPAAADRGLRGHGAERDRLVRMHMHRYTCTRTSRYCIIIYICITIKYYIQYYSAPARRRKFDIPQLQNIIYCILYHYKIL